MHIKAPAQRGAITGRMDEDEVTQALRSVEDPEAGMNIVDLGLVYEAAGGPGTVGGDFYDMFPLGGDRWCFVVGDVCGTGAGAAAVTGLARHTIRALAPAGTDVRVELVWEPPWTPERMSAEARSRFGW